MGVDCVVNANFHSPGTRMGPLNVVGVEEGAVCEPNQPRTVMCSLNPDQGNVKLMPRVDNLTIKTTKASGAIETRVLSAPTNGISYKSAFPPGGILQEFVCQIENKPIIRPPNPHVLGQ